MATWLYQLSADNWSPERYRVEIWEGERWNWSVGAMSGAGQQPAPGDIMLFFYAKSAQSVVKDPGFYGWGVILDWVAKAREIHFRPAAPSDHLKMHPWWDDQAEQLADEIRGKMRQRTLWLVSDELVKEVRTGMTSWLAGQSSRENGN